ncbi:MAG: type I-E CRISPR-associated protein Cse1/CasA [Rhodospirillales bacterium]|nr:MAG: type I-E CRISPR-associated protein Cse1/CasA [Rhodospirillales bacterium]
MLSSFALLDQNWLPVRRASGSVETIRPSDVTAGPADDPIIAFNWPRADFDAAAREFMVGLLSTACWSRVRGDEWEAWWSEPPPPDVLQDWFAPLSPAFRLDGDGPGFMQDLDPLDDGSVCDVSALLIDAPGANTITRNADLFVKRGQVRQLGRPAAAMALFTLQTFAPSGGAGHRTSLRGGGPLTTIVVPDGWSRDAPPSLWRLLWANVFWQSDWPNPLDRLDRVFPWLAPTRVSKSGKQTTPDDVHPAQAFWGMPRRIRLDFDAATIKQPCDLTGATDDVVAARYRTRPHGNNYEGWSRAHPLTPYRRAKPGAAEWLPVHGQPGRLAYRDWLGLVVNDADDTPTRVPAAILSLARARLLDVGHTPSCRLSASGYDMDNMKARGFVESQMPLHLFPEGAVRTYADAAVRTLVTAARRSQDALSAYIGRALAPGNPPAAGKGDRHLATIRFWDQTEQSFYRLLDTLADGFAPLSTDPDLLEEMVPTLVQRVAREWLQVLRREALAIFDDLVRLDSLDFESLESRIAARRSLVNTFNGASKAGEALFTGLGLPVPERNPAGKRQMTETVS